MTTPVAPSESAVRAALGKVKDPEIGKPITDIGMVKSVTVNDDASVDVAVYLTTSGCPMRTEIPSVWRPRSPTCRVSERSVWSSTS